MCPRFSPRHPTATSNPPGSSTHSLKRPTREDGSTDSSIRGKSRVKAGGSRAHPLRRPQQSVVAPQSQRRTFPTRQASRRLRHAVAAGEHEGAGNAQHREYAVHAEMRRLWVLRPTSLTAGQGKSARQRQTHQPECAPERILDQSRPQFCTRAAPGDDVSRETRHGHGRPGRDVEFTTGSGPTRGCAIYSSSRHCPGINRTTSRWGVMETHARRGLMAARDQRPAHHGLSTGSRLL